MDSSLRLLVVFFFLNVEGVFAQVVEERILLDTNFITERVVYLPFDSGYYYTERAVFANDTSTVAIEKVMSKGKKNGVFKSYYPSGKLKVKSIYGNDKLHGEQVLYDEDGSIIMKGVFNEGVKHGYWAYRKLDKYGRFRRGKQHWWWYTYDEQGKKRRSFYRNGRLLTGKPIVL